MTHGTLAGIAFAMVIIVIETLRKWLPDLLKIKTHQNKI